MGLDFYVKAHLLSEALFCSFWECARALPIQIRRLFLKRFKFLHLLSESLFCSFWEGAQARALPIQIRRLFLKGSSLPFSEPVARFQACEIHFSYPRSSSSSTASIWRLFLKGSSLPFSEPVVRFKACEIHFSYPSSSSSSTASAASAQQHSSTSIIIHCAACSNQTIHNNSIFFHHVCICLQTQCISCRQEEEARWFKWAKD